MTGADRALVTATASRPRVVVVNKSDLERRVEKGSIDGAIALSVKTGEGLEALVDRVVDVLGGVGDLRDAPLVSNVRHISLLTQAAGALERARVSIAGSARLRGISARGPAGRRRGVQEITGQRTTDDLLRHIFERFCIGK